jgi:dimethylargininase
MQMIALTHKVSPKINECELSHLSRKAIDVEVAKLQHQHYCQILTKEGFHVKELTTNLEFPDSVFIEDTAVVLDEVAILCSMGIPSREGEVQNIAPILGDFRKVMKINPPATLEGGDVLLMNKSIYIGLSSRTNQEGIRQFAELVDEFEYIVKAVPVPDCLHLKSACTALKKETILINPKWIDRSYFAEHAIVEIDKNEPYAANCLNLNGNVYLSSAFPRTAEKIDAAGFPVNTINISELQKAGGALTCSSILFKDIFS